MIDRAIHHISETAKVPSFSTYEERLHPYVRDVFSKIPNATEVEVEGKSLIFQLGDEPDKPIIALAAHLDKINHYGEEFPDSLPVKLDNGQIEGAMDDCAGLGMILTLAEHAPKHDWPNLLFFFSEMEESKGLKEHPGLLRKNGKGYQHGMGAVRIAEKCLEKEIFPREVITLDTTPLFKGKQGIALYSKHWELNSLHPTDELIEATDKVVARFLSVDAKIKVDNNTNDYLQYGEIFNQGQAKPVVSVALEPAIYPYHQKGERVYVDDILRSLDILATYLTNLPA